MNAIHMSGAGNCFLVADTTHDGNVFDAVSIRELIQKHPRIDKRAIEGVILMRSCSHDRVVGDFYNPDGSHGMMCGNGARCIVRFAYDHGLARNEDVELVLNNMTFHARDIGENIAVDFPAPRIVEHYPVGTLSGVSTDVWYVDVGSDHAVIRGPLDPSRADVAALRHHSSFPQGVNVNMVDHNDGMHIATFERGVEAVTGACGTGALSCAIVEWMKDKSTTTFRFIPPSGRPLVVELHVHENVITNMTLIGDAQYDNA